MSEALQKQKTTYAAINIAGSSTGLLLGLGYAFHRKSSFWGYVGWGLLGSLVVGGVTGLATLPMAAKIANQQAAEGGTSQTSKFCCP